MGELTGLSDSFSFPPVLSWTHPLCLLAHSSTKRAFLKVTAMSMLSNPLIPHQFALSSAFDPGDHCVLSKPPSLVFQDAKPSWCMSWLIAHSFSVSHFSPRPLGAGDLGLSLWIPHAPLFASNLVALNTMHTSMTLPILSPFHTSSLNSRVKHATIS